MRVTIEHREEQAGITGAKRNYYVDCTVEFSEEERAIIKARGLQDLNFETRAATPPPTMTGYYGINVTRVIGRFLLLGFLPVGLIMGPKGEGLSAAMFFGGIGLELYGWLKGRSQDSRLENQDQNIKVRDLLSKGHFSAHAFDPAQANMVDEEIRTNLAAIKDRIQVNAEVRTRQTFEL